MTTTVERETLAYDPSDLDLGFFTIETSGGRFRWLWFEKQTTRENDSGTCYTPRSAALRMAADWWDRMGSGGDLALRLREASLAAERQERGPAVDIAPTEPERYLFESNDLTSGFYIIETTGDGKFFRWVWFTDAETRDAEADRWFDKQSTALRKAADDWDYAGDDGDLAQRLREAAAVAEERERAATAEHIIPTEVRIVEPGRGPGYDRATEHGERIAAHLCEVWGWLPDEPEAHDLGNRAASALTHAVAGSRTSADSLISTLLCIPSGKAPQEVYARALADVRTALLNADVTVHDELLAAIDLPNPFPVYDRS